MPPRMTKQKRLIMETALAHHNHPTADRLYLEIRAIDGKISRGTVYRVLERLTEDGVLLRIKVPGADRFDSRREFHYHMICSSCDMVYDVPLQYNPQLDKQLSEKTGFRIERHRTIFEGICPECLSKEEQ